MLGGLLRESWRYPEDALENAGHRVRHTEVDLRRLAAEIGQGKDQPAEDDAKRMQAPQERDDDRGEAIARRDRGRQLPDRPCHLEHAGKAGEPTADHQ